MAISIKATKVDLTAPPKKLDIIVESLDGVGKTFFGLTAPGPLGFHDFDNGLHRAAQGLTAERQAALELYKFEYDFARTLKLPGSEINTGLTQQSEKIWSDFVLNAKQAAEDFRSNIYDTGSAIWELLRLARLGKLTQVMPVQYTAVNLEFKELLQHLAKSPCNNIWLHRLKPLYENDKVVPGKFERTGYGDMGYEVDAVVRLTFDDLDGLKLRFGKCPNRALTGTFVIGQENISFPQIAAMIYPNTDTKYWQ